MGKHQRGSLLKPFGIQTNVTSYKSSVWVVLVLVLVKAVNLCISCSSSSLKQFVCLDLVLVLVLSFLLVSF